MYGMECDIDVNYRFFQKSQISCEFSKNQTNQSLYQHKKMYFLVNSISFGGCYFISTPIDDIYIYIYVHKTI